jgi:enoyl-CoA hydratase/carnithine racemase
MAYETIKFDKEDGYYVITLNRPKALNSIGKQTTDELTSAIDEIVRDDKASVFIITGAPRLDGRPCFCAGADLRDIAEGIFKPQLPLLTNMQNLWTGERRGTPLDQWEQLSRCPKVAIAAIDGICTAGGLEIALMCDIILVSETAEISDMHVKNLGGIGAAAATPLMARRVGVGKAIEIACTGDPIDGKEAHRIGFANQVFAPDKLMDGAKELARKISTMRPAAVQMVKATCRAVYDMDYRAAWRYADACVAALAADPDAGNWGAWKQRK